MKTSPCLRCIRVAHPEECENKTCIRWQRWYIERWEAMRFAVRKAMEGVTLVPAGVCIGGNHYSQPHRVREYLQHDPCTGCNCPRDVCTLPCLVKRNWTAARKNTLI